MHNTGKNRNKRIEQDKEQPTNKGKLEHASRDIAIQDKIGQPVHDTEMRYRALFENAVITHDGKQRVLRWTI